MGKTPEGTSILRRQGGLDLASNLKAKLRARSPYERKNLGSSVTSRAKIGTESRILGSYLKLQKPKFGVLATNIFGGKNWGSDTSLTGKFWGQAPLRPPNMEAPSPGLKPFIAKHQQIKDS